jgi:hypothetical protein
MTGNAPLFAAIGVQKRETRRDFQRVSDGLIRSSDILNPAIEEKEMFLASKAAWVGIVFILLTMRISGPRPAPLALGANLSKEVPALGHRNDLKTMQQTLRSKGYYRGEVDGVFGLRTRASIRGFQHAENLPVTGQLDAQTAGKLGVSPEGREETDRETTEGKPSAGIKSSLKVQSEKERHRMPWFYDMVSKTEQRRLLIFQHNYSRSPASRIRRHYVRLWLGGNTHRNSADCCCHPRSMNPKLWACEMRVQIRTRQTS